MFDFSSSPNPKRVMVIRSPFSRDSKVTVNSHVEEMAKSATRLCWSIGIGGIAMSP